MASITQIGTSWRALVRRKGHPSYCKTFGTKAAAVAWAAQIEGDIARGGKPTAGHILGRAWPLADVVAAYRKLRAGSRPIDDSSTEHYTLRHLVEHLGTRDVITLAVDDLVGYCRARSEDGAGPYTCNMDIGKLGTVLRLVSAAQQIPLAVDVVAMARPVLRHLGLIGGGGLRERRPTGDELHAILAHLVQHHGAIYADAVRFAVLTAMRRGEIVRVVWEDVDFERRTLVIRDRKDPRRKLGNDDTIPLLGDAWPLVLAQPSAQPAPGAARPSGRIWPIHEQTLTKYFTGACQVLGIPDLHFHDLRHEGVSRLFEAGFDIPEVAVVSGHKSWSHLKRYAQLRPEDLHAGPLRHARPGTAPPPDSLPSAGPGPHTSADPTGPR